MDENFELHNTQGSRTQAENHKDDFHHDSLKLRRQQSKERDGKLHSEGISELEASSCEGAAVRHEGEDKKEVFTSETML